MGARTISAARVTTAPAGSRWECVGSIACGACCLSEDGTAALRGASKHWQDREHFEGMYLLLYISPQPLAATAIV